MAMLVHYDAIIYRVGVGTFDLLAWQKSVLEHAV